jgi:uncharacterized protein YqfA (UPF0365 family)
MKTWIALVGLSLFSVGAQSQEVKRCDGPGGKVTYAETCPSNTKQTTMTNKGLSVTQADENQRKTEADFQKRHAAREATQAKERADQRRAAAVERSQNFKEEKMRREMAMKEERAKRGESKPRKYKNSKKKTA